MFWIIPEWTAESFKMIVEGIFFMFGLGETKTSSAAYKSLITGPLSVWLSYKVFTFIPAMKKVFTLYDALFTMLLVPGMLLMGHFGFDTGLNTDDLIRNLKGCTTGDHVYFNKTSPETGKFEVNFLSTVGCVFKTFNAVLGTK